MPRLGFDSVKNGTNVRKHGISRARFGDGDFDAALVADWPMRASAGRRR
jgi:hypothetical protein